MTIRMEVIVAGIGRWCDASVYIMAGVEAGVNDHFYSTILSI